jgi:hypothetical protein
MVAASEARGTGEMWCFFIGKMVLLFTKSGIVWLSISGETASFVGGRGWY